MFQLCSHIAQGDIPPQIAHVFRGVHFLAITKLLGGVCPNVMGKSLYQLTSCLQFNETFLTHFSPHQFGIAIKGGCETVIHGIKCTLYLHPNWVVLKLDMANAFNSMLRGVIFQKLCAEGENIIQFIPFVLAFYAFEFFLFYNHCNRKSDNNDPICHGNPSR